MDTKLIKKLSDLTFIPQIADVVSVQEKSAVKERPPTTPEEKRADHAPQDAVPLYTMSQVSDHCEFSDCWVVIFDRVYDITDFLNQHPGGEDVLLENAGRDATVPFMEVGHSKDAQSILKQYEIGMLVQNERVIQRKRYETC